MPDRPVDRIARVIEYLRIKNHAETRLEATVVRFAFTLLLARDREIVDSYIRMACDAGILTRDENFFIIDYTKMYQW